jgi:hypothetical protein
MRSAGGFRTDIRDGLSVLRSAAFGLNGGAALELADERRVRLEQLGDAANLDIKAPTGRSPWLRMRVGDCRVIYRPAEPGPGWYVARVVNRRDLDTNKAC